jgi:hypothetical protein
MPDRHLTKPKAVRMPGGLLPWYEDYATANSLAVNAVLVLALEEFRQRHAGATAPEPAKPAGATTRPARTKPARPVAAPASESPRKSPSAERGACPHRLPPGAFCKRCAEANGG